jgi:protein TonB
MSYKALLFCSEESTARVIAQVLSELGFQGEPYNEPFAAVKTLTSGRIDAMVIDCSNEQDAALLVKSARNSNFNQQVLFVAVVDGKSGVTNAFRLGANLVLTKPVSLEQARSTLRMARGLLHKNETAKPAAAATLPASSPKPESVTMAMPAAPRPPQVPVAPWPPPTPVSVPSASILEVEEEPAPSLEPAEAGVLESIPDPASSGKPAPFAWPAMAAKKESSWQEAAKPVLKPLPSSLLEAQEAAGKTEVETTVASPSSMSSSPIAGVLPAKPSAVHSGGAGTGAGPGAAAAPARTPAPETSGSLGEAATVSGQNAVPATITKLAEQKSESGNKKWLAMAAAVVAVAAAGYVGWTRLHPFISGAVLAKHLSSALSVPAVQPATSLAASEATPPESSDASPSQPPVSQTKAQPAGNLTPPRQAVPAPKSTANGAVSAPPAPAPTGQEVLVVSSQPEAPTSLPKPSAEPVPAAPAAIEVASASGDQAIPGIVITTNANLPAPTLENTKVSQGVAQGLLIKRVQPLYPPQARSMHLEGAVELQATIGKDGSVTNLKQLSGDAILGRAAMDAVRQWKYRPYLLDGQPVEIQTQITVSFKVQ